jgi:hypothetical protein
MDSQESRNPDDVVAFIDSDVRGVGSPTTPVSSQDRAILLIYSKS